MRYYSTQRPLGPGTYPKPQGNAVKETVNFDSKTYCEEVGLEAWGYIEYEHPLTEKEAERWELTPESVLWFPVTASSRKHGGGLRVTCGQPKRAQQRPDDTNGETAKMQWKTRYFKASEAERVSSVLRSLDITTERVRQSVNQGEVKVFINGEYILNFGDNIVLPERGADPESYYGADIGGWRSATRLTRKSASRPSGSTRVARLFSSCRLWSTRRLFKTTPRAGGPAGSAKRGRKKSSAVCQSSNERRGAGA